jgi:hypothetical protein
MKQIPFGRQGTERCGFKEITPLLELASVRADALPEHVRARLGTFMETLDLSYERFNSKRIFRESAIPGIVLYDFEKGCPKLSMMAGLRILEELVKSGDMEVLKATDVALRLAMDLARDFGVFDPVFLYFRSRDIEIIESMSRIENTIMQSIQFGAGNMNP